MSDILTALLFLLVPLRHSKADRRMKKGYFRPYPIIITTIIIIIIYYHYYFKLTSKVIYVAVAYTPSNGRNFTDGFFKMVGNLVRSLDSESK